MQLKRLFKILFIIFLLLTPISIEKQAMRINDKLVEEKIKKNNYSSYLYIPKYNKYLIIEIGNTDEILNKNNVAIINNGSKIDDKYSNIVLAGHNNKNVFNFLYNLNIDDEIIIINNNTDYKYNVYKKDYYSIKDTHLLNNSYTERLLTLITCTYSNQKRFIVHAK